ncbi:MAG: Transcriptional regulator [Promethearchaeota archaeon]|nr:MAG: Transcriptional regulator [Candidatus Lokiarchaeota archaeon]
MYKMNDELDDLDKRLLNILQQGKKLTYEQLGEKLGLAASTVHSRVQSLKVRGVIKRVGPLVDPLKAGLDTIAIIGLSVDPLKMDAVAHKLSFFDQIPLIASSTGDHDMIVQILARNEKELWRFINKNIKPLDGIRSLMDVASFIDIYKNTHQVKF